MDQVSEDGFWRFENGQWVPTEKQLEALSLGAEPHAEESTVSMQDHDHQGNKLINNQTNVYPTSQQHQITNQYPHDNANYDHKQPKEGSWFSTKMKIITGSSVVILTTLIILFAALSPGTSSLLDELKDSDGDGITDADELEMGTNPELRDSDNDDLDDDEDDCPVGDEDWKSTIVTDFDQDGCKDSTEDLDDDNDGVNDEEDNCDTSEVGWKSVPEDDNDLDGCHDDGDADDDNDGWSDNKEQQCGTNPLSSSSVPSDFDGDMICDIVDSDDDGDGVSDAEDNFPLDSSEWADFDGDGIGDNADNDDDNDGVVDSLDMNDYADVGLLLTYDTFKVITKMDYWDNEAEVYICTYVNGSNVGCGPDQSGYHWSLTTSTTYSLGTEIFVDLPETSSYHDISICAWDSDAFDDDRIDISTSSSNNCYNFNFYTTYIHSATVTASGEGDGQGWDGELVLSYEVADLRTQRIQNFQWTIDGSTFSMNLDLDYSTYTYYRSLDHTISGYTAEEKYSRFPTPDAQYVIDIANQIEDKAVQYGYTTELEKAEFLYAFVGDIQYVLDIEGTGVSDYPKYPIEMLWEASGDCEDAAILFVSLAEAMGLDAVIARGSVKQSSDEDWGGHAWAMVKADGASGTYVTGISGKSSTQFFFVETTGHQDGVSYIGRNPWYDITNDSYYDVE